MNDAATVQRRENEPLNLGTKFGINLCAHAEARTTYSIEQFIAALEMTTTLTTLSVTFSNYWPSAENNRRFIEPLCRCLSNLRSRNEHHPLRALTLLFAGSGHGMLAVLKQFLFAAAKYGGIYHLELAVVDFLPVQVLVDFCRNNNNLKVLELNIVIFSVGRAAMSLPPNQTQDSSVMLALDKLRLHGVSFYKSAAVTAFADFIARMTVQALELGKVWERDYDLHMTKSILPEIRIPAVKQLELNMTCRIEHFKAALEAGTSSLIELDVHINDDKNVYTKRLELLTYFIRRAVQLSSLTVHVHLSWNRPITLPRELLRAIEACATVTRIPVDGDGQDVFRRDELQQLQGIAARNEELARLVASPITYPTDKLLWLMRQFGNCSTGRYMLVRCLPEAFSFDKGNSLFPPTSYSKPRRRLIVSLIAMLWSHGCGWCCPIYNKHLCESQC